MSILVVTEIRELCQIPSVVFIGTVKPLNVGIFIGTVKPLNADSELSDVSPCVTMLFGV